MNASIQHCRRALATVVLSGLAALPVQASEFISGNFIEAGVHEAGSFGTTTGCKPAHFHDSGFGCRLGFIADFQKDGWGAGTPPYGGDYFLPGTPYEGWVVEWTGATGAERTFFNSGAIGAFAFARTASSSPSPGIAIWEGAGAVGSESLSIRQTVTIPVDKGYMLVEVVFTNTGSVPLNSLEYLRGVDPDQGIRTTNNFETFNSVDFQPPRAAGPRPALAARPAGNTNKALSFSRESRFGIPLGLGTVDPRAVASAGVGWPIGETDGNHNAPGQPTPASPQFADRAQALAFDLGTLAPGASTRIKFAYVLAPGDLDDAFRALAPTLDGLTDQTLEATNPAGAVATYSVTANDAEDGVIAATCVPPSGSTFPLGMTTVNCSATDSDGNETTGSFTVTVVDTTPPSLSLPADLTREATGPGGAMVSYSASASDIVDGSVPVTCTPPSGSTFPLGLNTVSCHATDAAGNTGSDMFSVTVVDTTPPALTLPDDLTREATGAAGAAVTYSATASDTVDGSVAPVCTPASGAVFPLGATPVNCSATDAAGNNATGGFTVTVRDTTAPALTCPSSITGTFGQTVNLGTPTTSDLVDATPTLANNAPGSFPAGTTTVRWTSTDDAGNQASCEQTVTLRYTFQGFFQPVDNLPAVNTVKNGSTVPVKWRLLDANGAYITDTATVLGIGYVPSACGGPEDAIEELAAATGGTTLRWDGSSQFIYNWKTPALPGKCVRLDVRFNDGTTRSANFKLK